MSSRRPDIYPAPRVEFGAILRQARDKAGLQGKDVAKKTDIVADTISRFETGKRFPKRSHVELIARALNLNEAATADLLEKYDDAAADDKALQSNAPYGPKAAQEDRNKRLAAAKEVNTFGLSEIPYYLQTRDYALQEMGDAPDARTVAELRVEAGSHVGARGKRFDIVLTEAALRLLPCDPHAMRVQISHLQGLIGKPGVTFGIVPLGVELSTPLKNAFTVYDDTTVIDTFAGEVALTPRRTVRYLDLMNQLDEDAVHGGDAQGLLAAAMSALPNS
jgi:transcriptional regulator with XRE-family HTH domain